MHLLKDLIIVFAVLITAVFVIDYVSSSMIDRPVIEHKQIFTKLYCESLMSVIISEDINFVNNTRSDGIITDFIGQYNDSTGSYTVQYKITHNSSFGDELQFCSVVVISDESVSGDYYDCENAKISFSSEKTSNYLMIQFSMTANKKMSKYQFINPKYKSLYDDELGRIQKQVDGCEKVTL